MEMILYVTALDLAVRWSSGMAAVLYGEAFLAARPYVTLRNALCVLVSAGPVDNGVTVNIPCPLAREAEAECARPVCFVAVSANAV